MPEAVIVILLLLGAAVCLEIVAERFDIPRPVVLLSGGMIIALVPGLPRLELDPETIFILFVPPLLYWAALTSSLRDFRTNAVVISMAGMVLVLVTIAAVAVTVRTLIPSVPWAAAVALGAIIAPPDAVVAISMLRGLKLPRPVTTFLVGESLVNDATALVVYRTAVAAAVAGQYSWLAGTFDFVRILIGGAGIGLAVGWLVAAIRRRAGSTSPLQNTISLLTPFAAYVPATALHVSGVFAVVVAGIYIGRRGPHFMSPETRIQARDTWDVVTYILESLTFLLIGLDLPYAQEALHDFSGWDLIRYTAAVSGVIVLVRILAGFPAAIVPRWLAAFRGQKAAVPPWRHVLFVGWAGLRGGDSLIVALTLPVSIAVGSPFPSRNLIIVMTFGVVLISILIQGLSLRPLARLLGLRSDGLAEAEERIARHRVALAGLAALDGIDAASVPQVDGLVVSEILQQLRDMHASEPVSSSLETRSLAPPVNRAWIRAYHEMRSRMVRAERTEAVRLRDEDVVSDEVMYRLLRAIDFEEVLLEAKLTAIADGARKPQQ